MSDSKKILLVEGNSTLSGMIQSGLEQAGFEVAAVDNGREAWDTIHKGFDLLVTDYEMSDSVGAKICSGIRQHRKHKSMPMIVLCGDRGADLEAIKAEYELAAIFKKPLSVSELVSAAQAATGATGA